MTSGGVAVPRRSPLPSPVPPLMRGPWATRPPSSLLLPPAALAGWQPSPPPRAQREREKNATDVVIFFEAGCSVLTHYVFPAVRATCVPLDGGDDSAGSAE